MKLPSIIPLTLTLLLVSCVSLTKTHNEIVTSNDLIGSWATKEWVRHGLDSKVITFFENFTYEEVRFRNDKKYTKIEGKWSLTGNYLVMNSHTSPKKYTKSEGLLRSFSGSEFKFEKWDAGHAQALQQHPLPPNDKHSSFSNDIRISIFTKVPPNFSFER